VSKGGVLGNREGRVNWNRDFYGFGGEGLLLLLLLLLTAGTVTYHSPFKCCLFVRYIVNILFKT